MKRTHNADEARMGGNRLQWYQKTALSGAWSIPMQAANEEEVRWMHAQDLSLNPGLAVQYPGPYRVERVP